MIAYQCVDPACGLAATRVPVAQVTGRFLCRRVRGAFSRPAVIDLLAECRSIRCKCGARFDADVLTAEHITPEAVDILRFECCPDCGVERVTHLQFRRNGLILSREEGAWFIWLNQVTPNRCGNLMEEHLFWYQVDWTRRNVELAEELNLPEDVVQSWRRKLAKLKAPTSSKPQRARNRTTDLLGRRRRV